MNILVLNSGSSSLKFQMINMENEQVLCDGIVERIGLENTTMKYKNKLKNNTIKKELANVDHKGAISTLLKDIVSDEIGVLNSLNDIKAIGHRVAHGGDIYKDSVVVDEEVEENIENLIELAPLHNPANLTGIRICKELMPEKLNVAVFDTAFHQTLEPKAFMYALPYREYEELKVRKYGFHGTSHKYVYNEAVKKIGKEDAKIIVCHLGNGASISAIDTGECIETSMGLTPLQGLVMGTRSGDIDPAAVLYIMKKRHIGIDEMEKELNKESGLYGLFGKSSDLRDILAGMNEGDKRAKLAFDVFVHKVKHYLGAYTAHLGGIDAVCFTAGIGENSSEVRKAICENMEYLGLVLDEKLNENNSGGIISSEGSKVKVLKIETNEELMIAKDTSRLASS